MADKSDLKRLLRVAVAAKRKYATEQQLDEATELLTKQASITREGIRALGESVAHDPELFAASDPDSVNDILGELRRK